RRIFQFIKQNIAGILKLFPVKQKDFNVAEIFGVSTKACRANIAGINFGEIYADFE
ncbi:hypothetical protein HKBW3S42_02475, partial [Candidatus Hakubella thermalkaliphila]